jgi:DNA-binding NtrC family response regulator
MHGTVQIVDDDADTAALLQSALTKRGFETYTVRSAEESLEQLKTHKTDIVVTDIHMGAMSGIDLCAHVRRDHPDTLALVITGAADLATAIAAIQAGAYDYIAKPVSAEALAIVVSRGIDHLMLKRELARLRERTVPAHGISGSTPAIQKTIDMIARVASSDATILITGESGTGKELVARALHAQSGRAKEPFIAINCAAMPAPLLESELFGHVQGAFTDAKRARDGLFVQAGAGTILLDEIGEMPLEMQVKLLRVLQERTVRQVGGSEETPIRARVVAATNRDLEREVQERRFREDLFYRINVVQIAVPPLRERSEDVLQLAQTFLVRSARTAKKAVEGISPPAALMLREYDWPGNVRELENCIERAVALCAHSQITVDDLPPSVVTSRETAMTMPSSPLEMVTLDELERRYVRQVLAATDGNKTRAAKVLGIDRRSLYRRLEPANLDATEREELRADAGNGSRESSPPDNTTR